MRFPSQHPWSTLRSAVLVSATVLAVAGCDRIADNSSAAKSPPADASEAANSAAAVPDELAWARTALQRNPGLELVATDPQSGVFTVRIKRTGETQIVKLSEIVAGPAAQMTAAQSVEPSADSAPATTAREPNAAAALLDSAPAEPPRSATTGSTATSGLEKGYTIERSDGQTRVSGPGVSIVSSGMASATPAGNAGQRSVDPMICEGHRMLHFDNRSIYVDGDAIVARGGCELYITNSRIVAAGTGVVVRDAIVHISNSTIEGSTASFDASDEARMYLRASTFQGLPRRGEKAVVQDQGGNQWH
jgi:hypothetical protein